MIDRTALRDVADTMYACREWFEGYKVAYTGADLIAMARMVMERELLRQRRFGGIREPIPHYGFPTATRMPP